MSTEMDFILNHAKEIMYLCFGVGFLVLIGFLCQSIYVATRVFRKIDDLSDIFIQYVQKPLRVFLQVKDVFMNVREWFRKK